MVRPVAADIADLDASSQALRRTLADLREDQVRQPSLLPGWTRAHVVTHLARNADALCHLVEWARTGVQTPMYASREQRAADIEAGARRSAVDLVTDYVESERRLFAAMAELDEAAWESTVRWGTQDASGPARTIPRLRRIEVEIHHVDLDLDYTLAHLPPDFVLRMIANRATDLSTLDDLPGFTLVGNDNEGSWPVRGGGSEITGTPASLLGWLLGRTDGIGVHSDQPLPQLGPWR